MLLNRWKLLCGLSLFAIIGYVVVFKVIEKQIERFQFSALRPLALKQEAWMQLAQNLSYSDYGDNTCERSRDRAIYKKLMKRWMEIAREYNVTYFLTYGSLLGAWRNQEVVPYDLDMDVSIDWEDNIKLEKSPKVTPFNQYDNGIHLYLHHEWRLEEEKRRRLNCDGKEVESQVDHCSFTEPGGRLITEGVHLDLYNYKSVNNKVKDVWDKEYFINDIFTLKKCLFMGLETVCPKNPQPIFEAFYGKDYLRPSRICKNGTWVER